MPAGPRCPPDASALRTSALSPQNLSAFRASVHSGCLARSGCPEPSRHRSTQNPWRPWNPGASAPPTRGIPGALRTRCLRDTGAPPARRTPRLKNPGVVRTPNVPGPIAYGNRCPEETSAHESLGAHRTPAPTKLRCPPNPGVHRTSASSGHPRRLQDTRAPRTPERQAPRCPRNPAALEPDGPQDRSARRTTSALRTSRPRELPTLRAGWFSEPDDPQKPTTLRSRRFAAAVDHPYPPWTVRTAVSRRNAGSARAGRRSARRCRRCR
ncbi:hypothetical protein ATK36_4995 [Amycolatopsis sulphurea]|uniref:Uncharacterized protein n=1 Tax=Amycolatopsis sulphurea TaxID=76022 RepID=A0A2A9FGE1_9PSEU|nr:hypothetical protein ATK36_4995 [Amycolatopsis sulphurea]